MINNKLKFEKIIFGIVIFFIILHGFIRHDSYAAIISAVCGISYTAIAGKGRPVCYLFGITGSFFYCWLSFKNLLWGNLLLYAGYYIPMQFLGFFQWNKNLKKNSSEIIKISISKTELWKILILTFFGIVILSIILFNFKDSHPVLDSITTILSLGGMYLTVRRAIQQWIFWMGVNALSLYMWLNVAISGERVLSTVIMWAVYLFLAIYFYLDWKKDIYKN